MKLIVADSSPLIALACSGHIDVLLLLIETVVIPGTVYRECVSDNDKPGATKIEEAVSIGRIRHIDDPDLGIFEGIPDLDAGEAAALALAIDLKAPVLMDDAIGREVARANNISVVGACGILLQAKNKGLIDAVAPIIQTWRKIGYFLSDSLIAEVLRRAGE